MIGENPVTYGTRLVDPDPTTPVHRRVRRLLDTTGSGCLPVPHPSESLDVEIG